MTFVFYGDHFYFESGTMMGSMCTEDGKRADWNTVQACVERGETAQIRAANADEYGAYEKRLRELKKLEEEYKRRDLTGVAHK